MALTKHDFSIEFIPDDDNTKGYPPLPVYIRIVVDQYGINLLVKKADSDPSPDDITNDPNFKVSNLNCDISDQQWTNMVNRHKYLTKVDD